MTRMSNDMFAQEPSAANDCVRAIAVIGSILAAVLFTMALAGSQVRPAHAVIDSAEAPELRPLELYLQRSGTITGYEVLL